MEKWVIVGGREVVERSPSSCLGDQTTRSYRHRGSREGRGQGCAQRVVEQVWAQRQEPRQGKIQLFEGN